LSSISARRRQVAVSESLARLIADHYAEAVVEQGASAEGYVWPGRAGAPMAADTPTQIIERAQDRCGLVENPKPRPKGERPRCLVTLHGLRHTAGSIALAAGVPLIAVSRQLGHSNPQMRPSTRTCCRTVSSMMWRRFSRHRGGPPFSLQIGSKSAVTSS